MKVFLRIFLAVLLAAAFFAAPAFSAVRKAADVKGVIVKVEKTKNSVTIKTEKGALVTVKTGAKASFKVGDRVETVGGKLRKAAEEKNAAVQKKPRKMIEGC
ncbi:MAG: hypothetical protein M0Z59_06620 [Nitrospiraceae bacterium]|nr:hypothetical protein [Nitrospiraceae bacterium]